MIEPSLLRNQPQLVADNLARRGEAPDMARFAALDERRKTLQSESENLRARRKEKARAVAAAKHAGGEAPAVKEAEEINARIKTLEAELSAVQEEIESFSLDLPNLLHDSVPPGETEKDNREVRTWGDIPRFSFAPRDHVSLGENLNMMDFAMGVKLASARFVAMSGALARLHRAIAQFMLDLHINEHGYKEVYMPFMANAQTLTGTGQLPKFKDDLFFAARDDLYLIPTAEVVVTNIARGEILPAKALPQKYVCHTPCFRREAGSYGKDTRGMLRQHQFEKVELVHVTTPEQSYAALEEMTRNAERVLRHLCLPYRVVLLCAGDTGFAAAKTCDIEVWMPGQNAYREISSCSNCEAFQARRMKARYRAGGGKPEYVHTLNGSGVAVGRALIAVMENGQRENGDIVIPPPLRPYMGGAEVIAAA